MVKAYLKYEPATSFGVVSSATAGTVSLPPDGRAPVVAVPAVDAVRIWNLRSGTALAKIANASTRKAGHVTAIALAPDDDTLAAGYLDGSIRIWSVSQTLQREKDVALVALDEGISAAVDHEPVITFNGHRSAVSSLSFLLRRENQQDDDFKQMEYSEPPRSSTLRSSVQGNPSGRQCLTFALTGSKLASGSNDGDVILWDLNSETGIFRLMAHNDMVTSLKLVNRSPAAVIISASKDGLVRVHDIESQHCLQTLVGHHAEIWAMDIDPLQRFIVTGSIDADLRVYRFQSNSTASFSDSKTPGGDRVEDSSSTDDGLEANEVLVEIGAVRRAHAASRVVDITMGQVEGEAFMTLCTADKSSELFRVRKPAEAENHRKRRQKRQQEKEEKIASSVRDQPDSDQLHNVAERLDIVTAKDLIVSLRSFKTPTRARSVSFARVVSSRSRNSITNVYMVYQLNNNALELHRSKMLSKIKKKASKKKKHLAQNLHDTGLDVVEELNDETEIGQIELVSALDVEGHRGDVRSISISPDDDFILSASRNTAKVWNLATGLCIRTMSTVGNSLCTCFAGPSARLAVVGTKEGTLEMFDIGNGEPLAFAEDAHGDAIWSMSLDGHVYDSTTLITGSADKLVRFWDLESVLSSNSTEKSKLLPKRTLEMRDEVLCVRVAFNRDHPVILVSLMDSTVQAFDLRSLNPYMSFYGHKMPVLSMDVSSDGLLLATGSADKTIKVWGMDFGDCRRSLRAHSESVMAVVFQPKTHYLFSGSRDGLLKYWDCDKFDLITSLEGQSGEVWALAVGEDGEFVASASRDRLVRVWRRTDEQIFLEEEQDKRMDEMFESSLIDDDSKEAAKIRGNRGTFFDDPAQGESYSAGKRSGETIKAGEKLSEALELAEAERMREQADPQEPPSPFLLGLSAEQYVLRAVEQIRAAELEEALNILPLHRACLLLDFCSVMLQPSFSKSRLAVELLCRAVLYVFKVHHSQIVAGALNREIVSSLTSAVHDCLRDLRSKFGFTASALSFWEAELADMQDMPFQDAPARAQKRQRKLERRQKKPRV